MISNKKIGVSIIFVFLLSLFSVYAQDFSLTSSSTSASLCSGETVLFTAQVKNNGNNVESFTFNIEGLARSWVTAIPLGAIVKPGETETVFIYATPNSRVTPSDYGFNLVASAGSSSQRLGFDVKVRDCHEVQASGFGQDQVCAESTETYNIEVKNSGLFDESYIISVSGSLRNYVSLSQSVLNLKQGESKVIFANVNYPVDIKGKHNFAVNINSRTSNANAAVNFPIDVLGCFDFGIRASKDFVNIC